ncbi:MAG: cysteine peptidase family C39 domain-containing protein [Succinivibrionaceae bacterium]
MNNKIYHTSTTLQMERTECGAACLSMILKYYGRFVSLEKLREECGVSNNGTKASNILKVARDYGLECKAYKITLDDLVNQKGPSILFWNFEHWVVFEGCSKNKKYYINDPAIGRVILDADTIEKCFTGVVLCFEKTPKFLEGGKENNNFTDVWSMTKGLKSILYTILWCNFLLVIPSISIPLLMQLFIDYIMPVKGNWIISMLMIFIIIIIIQIVLSSLYNLALCRGEIFLSINRTVDMLNYLFKLPISFFTQRGTSDIHLRISLNSILSRKIFSIVIKYFFEIFSAIFIFFVLLLINPLLTLVTFLFLAIDVFFIIIFVNRKILLNKSIMADKSKLQNLVLMNLESLENIKASGKEDSVFITWVDELSEYIGKQLNLNYYNIYMQVVPCVFSVIGSMLVLSMGSLLIVKGALTVGQLLGFVILCGSFISPFTALVTKLSVIQFMKVQIAKVNDTYHYEKDTFFSYKNVPDLSMIRPYAFFEFKNVSFSYNKYSEEVLHDISFKVSPGQRLAIVGASGSGKSTIAKIISGILHPTSGEIFLNNHNVRDFSEYEYYQMVGSVDQNVILFSGTVGENIGFFDPKIDNFSVQKALRDASLERELVSRGNAINLEVLEGGKNFSGGQVQRFEIARVFLRDPSLLVLDEATSALDTTTEKSIDCAIRRKGCATIIIAHRLSTIRDVEHIIVLDKGRICEQGTYEELMKNNGLFKKLMLLEDYYDE